MMQIRSRDGDKRWYDPDRDLIYALPRIVKTVLNTFEPTQANFDFAHCLGNIFVQCRKCEMDISNVKFLVEASRRRFPEQYAEFLPKLFNVLMGEMRWGCGNVSTKGADDPVVNLFGLDNIGPAMLAAPKRWWQIWRKA